MASSRSSPALPLSSEPTVEQGLRRDGFDLLAETVHINVHHRVVCFVCGAAKGVSHEDDTKTPVNSAEHGTKYAYIRFTARDDDRVDRFLPQAKMQVGSGPRRLNVLV